MLYFAHLGYSIARCARRVTDRTKGDHLMHKTIVAAILIASAANAQELPHIDSVLAGMDGTEVAFSGKIGSLISRQGFVIKSHDMESYIPSDLAINREQLAELEGCQIEFFSKPCTADIKAELSFSTGSIRAIVFDVQNVTKEPE